MKMDPQRMGLFACLPAELRRNSYGLLDNLAVKRTQKKRGDVLVRRTNEPLVRPSTAKEDLPWRLLASENPTPTETDFPQQAHRAVSLFRVAKTTPSFFLVSLAPLCGGDYTTANYTNCYTDTSRP